MLVVKYLIILKAQVRVLFSKSESHQIIFLYPEKNLDGNFYNLNGKMNGKTGMIRDLYEKLLRK